MTVEISAQAESNKRFAGNVGHGVADEGGRDNIIQACYRRRVIRQMRRRGIV